jgi:hypothetical protein
MVVIASSSCSSGPPAAARRRSRTASPNTHGRPSVETVLERQRIRGRPSDRDIEDRRRHAEHQLACLGSDLVSPDWVIDSSGETLEETYSLRLRDLVS